MVECDPKLSIRFKNGEEAVDLPLWPEGCAPLFDEVALPCVDADATVEFLLQGIAVPRFLVSVAIGDVSIAVSSYDDPHGLRLVPTETASPFADTIGLAKLTITVNFGPNERDIYEAMPIRVRLQPGLAAENLMAMSATVDTLAEAIFGNDRMQTRTLDEALEARLRVLSEVADLYDRYYPYFREQPRHRLSTVVTRQNIDRLREVTPATLQWIATHPYELQQVSQGTGVRSRGRTWMPRHVPMRTIVQDRDIIENRAVLGFVAKLVQETKAIVASLKTLEDKSGDAVSLARASRILASQIQAVEGLGQRLQRLVTIYQDALGVPIEALQQVPAPTAHFLETAQYRRVYEYMRQWFTLPPIDVDRIVQRLMSVTSPKLYEYFSLVTFLRGLHAEGYELTGHGLQVYDWAGGYYDDHRSAAKLNTFVFTNGERRETIRLWYEPVIGGLPHQGCVGPNGLGLFRATSWSMSSREPMVLEPSERCWYWPDFVVSLKVDGRTAWGVVDSKYSTINTVIRYYGASQVFKYLMSLRPIKPEDVFAGLWLWCGSVTPDASPEGSFFDVAAAGGVMMTPDLVLRRLNGLMPNDGGVVNEIVNRLRAVLAHG